MALKCWLGLSRSKGGWGSAADRWATGGREADGARHRWMGRWVAGPASDGAYIHTYIHTYKFRAVHTDSP